MDKGNLTQSPSGSISIIAGTTSGCEPLFQKSYKRKKKSATDANKWEEYDVIHPKLKEFTEITGKTIDESPYNEYHEVDWKDSVDIQSIIQKYIDHSISKTINLPKGTTCKSSILMVLNFAIYGNITTLKNELLANITNKNCVVKTTIKISDNEYLFIKRGLSPNKLECKFQVGEKDITASFGKKELQSIINDRFQIPQNIFNNLICINISDYNSFFEIPQSERKLRIDKIFNLTELNKYLEIVKDILKSKKLELNDFQVNYKRAD